jgi:hypothetical protein
VERPFFNAALFVARDYGALKAPLFQNPKIEIPHQSKNLEEWQNSKEWGDSIEATPHLSSSPVHLL